jgi:hypothetical protein
MSEINSSNIKMKKNLIRVFINNKNIIEISPLSSIFSLKDEIKTKISHFVTLPIENINLHFKGKPLSDDKKSLVFYNIEDNSNITAVSTINGGSSDSSFWLYLIYYICIPLYLIFLVSGLPPFVANCFGYIFDKTVVSILSYFGANNNGLATKMIRIILNTIMWFVKNIATILFVWATASYMIFPWLYSNNNDYCNSGLAAKDVGFWVMFVYILIYGSLNIVDFVINILQTIVDLQGDPEIIKSFLGPSIQAFKETWDIAKFAPFYAIPFVGQFFMFFHEFLDVGMALIYEAMDTIQQFDCDDKNTSLVLDTMLTGIVAMLKSKSKTRVSSNPINKNSGTTGIANFQAKLFSGAAMEPIKNYKLEPMIKLLRQGFHDLNIKNTGKPLPKLEGTEWELGGFNRWSSSFMTSFFCQFLEAMNDITDLLWGIGTENEVVNMIKTGNFAGLLSAVFMLIMFIWTWIFSSFGGYKYK